MSRSIRFTSLAIGLLVLAACGDTPVGPDSQPTIVRPQLALNAAGTSAAGITPTLVEFNNQSNLCGDAGYLHGWKAVVNDSVPAENYNGGTYNSPDGYLTVTVTVTYNNTGNPDTRGPSIAFSANRRVDGVVVHGGGGKKVHIYDYSANALTSDADLTTPINSSGQHANISNIAFCYDYRPDVTKTANTTYQRDWSWTISKTASEDTLTLQKLQNYTVNYTVTVGASSVDSNWQVAGNIVVTNPSPVSMSVTVADLLANAVVTCPNGATFTLAAGATETCTYTAARSNADPGTNTATATASGNGFDGNTATAAFSFGNPTTEINPCVSVTDVVTTSFGGNAVGDPVSTTLNSNLCRGGQIFNYSAEVGGRGTCGEWTVANTASAGGQTASASVTVFVTGCSQQTICDIDPTDPSCNQENPPACTLSQGYWKTHSNLGPARPQRWTNGAWFGSSTLTWISVWRTPPAGNAYYSLAHQYMGASLNQSVGNATLPAGPIADAYAAATAFFTANPVPTTKLSGQAKANAAAWAALLESWNAQAPYHCDEQTTS